MSTVNTLTFADFVRLAPFEFKNGVESIPAEIRGSGIFQEEAFPMNAGNTKEYNELDVEEYAKGKKEGDQAQKAKFQLGYTKILRLKRVAFDVDISYEARTQGKYPELLKRMTSIGRQLSNRMELDLQHRLTFGDATTYTDLDGESVDVATGDGLALFATAHTLRGSGTTYRNILSGNAALSESSLEALEKQAVENTLNHFGQKMTCSYDILWTTDDPATCNTARRILQSTAQVAAANEGVTNVYRAKYKHVKLSRVATDANGNPDSSKAKYFGIVSSQNSSAYFATHEEPRLFDPMQGKSETEVLAIAEANDDVVYKGRAGYGIAICGAKWIHMSKGDGS